MLQFLIVFVFFLIAIGLMLLSLYFSKYKQNGESCCSSGNCATSGVKKDSHNCAKHNYENEAQLKIEKMNI